jgi:dephospho-CoA kinase
MQRDGCSAADAQARIAAQMPLEKKVQLADVVLNNDSSLEQLHEQVPWPYDGCSHGDAAM